MMYYFAPKQAGQPIYRLSVVHFWALIFTYMWAGPHHLRYTALPDWTQSRVISGDDRRRPRSPAPRLAQAGGRSSLPQGL